MDAETKARAIQLLEEGRGVRETAREVGCSATAISKLRRKAMTLGLPPACAPASLPTDPHARLVAIRDLWLTVAEKGLRRLAGVGVVEEDGSQVVDVEVNTRLAIQLGIASQRAAELHRLLLDADDLPDELPSNDAEARELVRRLCWRVAKRSGQAGAWKMAAAVGLTSAQQQPVRITYVRPVRAGAEPGGADGALPPPGTGPQLH